MDDQERREAAVKRIRGKRDFRNHLVSYLVINAFLVGVWALFMASYFFGFLAGAGYFWPVWVMLGWGVGLAFHGWNAYHEEKPISDEEIRREMGDSG